MRFPCGNNLFGMSKEKCDKELLEVMEFEVLALACIELWFFFS